MQCLLAIHLTQQSQVSEFKKVVCKSRKPTKIFVKTIKLVIPECFYRESMLAQTLDPRQEHSGMTS